MTTPDEMEKETVLYTGAMWKGPRELSLSLWPPWKSQSPMRKYETDRLSPPPRTS